MFYIVIILLIFILLWLLYIKNKFITLDNMNKEAWSNIKIYLQKRLDLIPNLVKTTKAYADYEKQTLEKVIKARNNLLNIDMANMNNISTVEKENNIIDSGLKSILMLSEAYPDLKANESFMNLQEQLTNVEEEIAAARKYYNGTCRELNIFVKKVPNTFFYNIFKFRKAQFFNNKD